MTEILPTCDGSYTLKSSRFDASYHSTHGAMTESRYVFLEAGLQFKYDKNRRENTHTERLNILEIGVGTLLNAALAVDFARIHSIKLSYIGVESEPPDSRILQEYWDLHPPEMRPESWQELIKMYPGFSDGQAQFLSGQRIQVHLVDVHRWTGPEQPADVVFFDAFSPEAQPEIWEDRFLSSVVEWMRPGGCLVTYCVKGEVRRRFKALGCVAEKLPGPPGKREMLRVHKPK